MDAPKGRYSVVERDGRLVVIDNGTGAPLPSTVPPPPVRPGRAGSTPAAPVSAAGPGAIDRLADLLVALASRGRDPQGRAVIAWEWQENGKVKRWDALLDRGQQRRLGRALLALVALPFLMIVTTFIDIGLFTVAALLALPWLLAIAVAVRRIYRDTDDPGLRR